MAYEFDDTRMQGIINAKLAIVRNILIGLSQNFPAFNFMLWHSLYSHHARNRLLQYDGSMNPRITMRDMNLLLEPILNYKQLLHDEDIAVAESIRVICLNDNEQSPLLVDKVQMGGRYTVDHIHVEPDGRHYFILHGMNKGESLGYEPQRFSMLLNEYTWN